MNISVEERLGIFEFTQGRCYYCRKQLAYNNYGMVGARGAWELDHKIPRSQGGSDHKSNLIAACVSCNRDKSDLTAISYRRLTKPLRINQRNKAIKNHFEALAVPLATLSLFCVSRLRNWWEDRNKRQTMQIAEPLTIRTVPWDAIIPLAFVVLIFILIFRAHRTT